MPAVSATAAVAVPAAVVSMHAVDERTYFGSENYCCHHHHHHLGAIQLLSHFSVMGCCYCYLAENQC